MTEINDLHGPAHFGNGDLYNDSIIVRSLADLRQRNPRLIPEDDLKWLDQRFVAPPNLAAARHRLHDHRAVFLRGQPGSGRLTAAKMLLHELRDQSGPFTPLPEEDGLNPNDVHPQSRLLLDLSHTDTATANARRAQLPTMRAVLPERHAYLVVVLPDDVDPHADLDLLQHIVPIGKPRGDLVLRRHLGADGIRLTDNDLTLPELKAHIDGPVRDIAGLAISVRQAAETNPHASTADWLEGAVAVTDRTVEVARRINSIPSIRDRAVLLAAAMCPDSTRDAVFFAAQKLLDVVGPPTGEPPRLEQDGYLKQLATLEIEVNDERVRFASFHYDHTVRVHFWDNYPDLRASFCAWADHLVELPWLTFTEREDQLDRFLEQALRTNCANEVANLINRWANAQVRGRPIRLRFAAQALTTGLNNDDHGRRFRDLVYDWATSNQLPHYVGSLLVRVCTEVIAPVYPEQAVVRLHQRARREGTNAPPTTARDALRELTSNDPILFRFLLQRLTDRIEKRPAAVDQALFLDLVNSPTLTDTHNRTQPLAADRTVRTQLVRGWYTILRQDPATVSHAVRRWLSTAADIHDPQLLLHIIVDAADHDVQHLATLHVLARDWSHTLHPRSNLPRILTRLIDAAQGIHPPGDRLNQGNNTMTRQNRILAAGLATAFALPIVAGLLLNWPFWITAPLLAAVLAGIYRKIVHPTYTTTDHVGELLDTAGLPANNPIRDLTAHRLAELIEATGNTQIATEIRREFDSPRP